MRLSGPRESDVVAALLARALAEPSAGGRLPPERDLARALETSRPTLRRALALLRGAGITEAVQGSGVRVRPRTEWSLTALPAWIAALPAADAPADSGPPELGSPDLRRLAAQALSMRRSLARQIPTLVGELEAGRLDAARRAASVAWAARGEPVRFVRADAGVVGAILCAGGALAAAWSWNDFSAIAIALAERGLPLAVPADYPACQEEALTALERGDGRGASRTLATHLARLDRELLRALPPSRATP